MYCSHLKCLLGCPNRRNWQHVSLPLCRQGYQVACFLLNTWTRLYPQRFGTKLGSDPNLEDMMWTSLTDRLSGTPMGVTAENLAAKFDVTRLEFWLRHFKSWWYFNGNNILIQGKIVMPLLFDRSRLGEQLQRQESLLTRSPRSRWRSRRRRWRWSWTSTPSPRPPSSSLPSCRQCSRREVWSLLVELQVFNSCQRYK